MLLALTNQNLMGAVVNIATIPTFAATHLGLSAGGEAGQHSVYCQASQQGDVGAAGWFGKIKLNKRNKITSQRVPIVE